MKAQRAATSMARQMVALKSGLNRVDGIGSDLLPRLKGWREGATAAECHVVDTLEDLDERLYMGAVLLRSGMRSDVLAVGVDTWIDLEDPLSDASDVATRYASGDQRTSEAMVAWAADDTGAAWSCAVAYRTGLGGALSVVEEFASPVAMHELSRSHAYIVTPVLTLPVSRALPPDGQVNACLTCLAVQGLVIVSDASMFN